jgi:hypothetical protein
MDGGFSLQYIQFKKFISNDEMGFKVFLKVPLGQQYGIG